MPGTSYSPRRRHRRFRVDHIPGSLAFSTEVEIANLSLSGMAVTTSVPLPAGKKFAVRIGDADLGLEFQGVVCWSRVSESSLLTPNLPSSYRSGLAFFDILTDRAQGLLQFMEQNIEIALDHQLFGRLELGGEARANLETDFRFEVTTLSAGGLCARISHPLAAGDEFEVELNLEGTPFSTLGRVAAFEAADDEAAYDLGMEFLDTEPEQMEVLSGYLRRQFEAPEAN
ncbi:MAG: PilZ domain-containing protein [Thermoanaerobaculia bacterium]|nr:PilZ domain-containing protein [Thermoanaerobaculia bacterium]